MISPPSLIPHALHSIRKNTFTHPLFELKLDDNSILQSYSALDSDQIEGKTTQSI